VPLPDRFADLLSKNPELAEMLIKLGETIENEADRVSQDPDGAGGLGPSEDLVEEAADEVVRKGLAEILRRFEMSAAYVEVNGALWRRMSRPSNGVYFARRGELHVLRHLYRRVDVRNGPTIVPLELRAGLVEGLWTPRAAEAAAMLLQNETAREAEATCSTLGVMPYSRSSLLRVADQLGERLEAHHVHIEDVLMSAFVVPDDAVAVSVAVDRVAVRMLADQHKASWRMAYCGVLTLHDASGAPLHAIRYGRMPVDGSADLEESLRGDLFTLLSKRPTLSVVALSDGADEMKHILHRVSVDLPVEVKHALDFWHVVEKVSAAITSLGMVPQEHLDTLKGILATEPAGAEQVVKLLHAWKAKRNGSMPEEVRDAIRYIGRNVGRMRYSELREAKLPIGSGHVEATCKTLVSTRMKRSGARWSGAGGQAILGLRSLARSSRWDGAMDALLPTYTARVTPTARPVGR